MAADTEAAARLVDGAILTRVQADVDRLGKAQGMRALIEHCSAARGAEEQPQIGVAGRGIEVHSGTWEGDDDFAAGSGRAGWVPIEGFEPAAAGRASPGELFHDKGGAPWQGQQAQPAAGEQGGGEWT